MRELAGPHARRQDHAAGMGAGAGASRRRPTRSSAKSGPDHAPRFDGRGRASTRLDAGTRRRAARAARPSRRRRPRVLAARRRLDERSDDATEPPRQADRAAASSPSSARPMPASRRWSTGWSAPRSRSSATRCRRRARSCAASPWPARSQIVFVDTPGIFRPKRRLDRAMVETAWGGARDADLVALLIDADARHRRRRRATPRKLADVAPAEGAAPQQDRPRQARERCWRSPTRRTSACRSSAPS